jgi:predicted dehydrogenase
MALARECGQQRALLSVPRKDEAFSGCTRRIVRRQALTPVCYPPGILFTGPRASAMPHQPAEPHFSRRQLAATTIAAASVAAVSRSARAATAPIRIGQIGVGHAHADKLAVYRQSPEYEVVGVVEPDPALREQARNKQAYRDLPWLTQDRLLSTPGLQAVLVETAVRDSLAAAEAAVTAGMHVHLDKPAGESLPHFQRILAEADRQGLMVQLGYMYRYNPAVLMLREFLRNGWLGEVFEVHAVMSKVVPPADRRDLAAYSGGILFELGCHVLDLVIGVLGRPEGVRGVSRDVADVDDGLHDNMLAVLEYPKAIATVKSSAVEVNGFARRHLVVCGTEGTFHIQPLDNPSARVALNQPRDGFKAGEQDVTFPKFTRYVADAADMAQVIRGEKTDDFPSSHELAVQATLLEACGLL